MKDLLCARCLILNDNSMAPRVYALLDNEELSVDLGAVPLIEAHARGAALRSGLGPIPMEAVTMVAGTALCWLHLPLGSPVQPPRGGPQPPAGWRRPGA